MKFESIKKVAVFRALQIGDMLCSIPAIRALKHSYPNIEITLIGLPWAKMLIERFPQYFNSLITFPGYPGFPEQPVDRTAFPEFLREVQQQNFDLALQMQGNGIISNPLVDLFAAKHIAGFYSLGNYCPDKNLFIEYPSNLHEVRRHLKLVELLGVAETATDLEFPITTQDEEDFAKAALPVSPKEYVILHPGARGANRLWDTSNFAQIGDYCAKKGWKVVITGTKDEAGIVDDVIQQMKHKPVNAAGKTSLGAVAVLIRNAAALVSNCTGVSHIAAALKTRSIVISLDGEPFRWAPLNKQLHKTIDWTITQDLNLVKTAIDGLLSAIVS
ncbi:MAG: glycosyltransferase family 9 protein [Bacteroidota bacterium]|nr:glycosyltransferase family 9 protein [Bacteroidota bacterium]